MDSYPSWQYDEAKACGVDYSRPETVAEYDRAHRRFRDYAQAADTIVRRLGLGPESVVVDLGAGTGAFALHAARQCRTIHAVDASAAMLDFCRTEAAKAGIGNIVFHHAGLLTYEHAAGDPADAAVCVAVLHHLPDFWKQAALARCHAMLKPGGKFLLFDIVLPSAARDLPGEIDRWIAAVEASAGQCLAQEAVVHIRDEYSTYDWILEGILRRSGFRIDSAEYAAGFQTTYVCTAL